VGYAEPMYVTLAQYRRLLRLIAAMDSRVTRLEHKLAAAESSFPRSAQDAPTMSRRDGR